MLPLLRISLVLTIATVIQYADGIVCISELTSGEGDNTCCLYGNCSCNSLDHALLILLVML